MFVAWWLLSLSSLQKHFFVEEFILWQGRKHKSGLSFNSLLTVNVNMTLSHNMTSHHIWSALTTSNQMAMLYSEKYVKESNHFLLSCAVFKYSDCDQAEQEVTHHRLNVSVSVPLFTRCWQWCTVKRTAGNRFIKFPIQVFPCGWRLLPRNCLWSQIRLKYKSCFQN